MRCVICPPPPGMSLAEAISISIWFAVYELTQSSVVTGSMLMADDFTLGMLISSIVTVVRYWPGWIEFAERRRRPHQTGARRLRRRRAAANTPIKPVIAVRACLAHPALSRQALALAAARP